MQVTVEISLYPLQADYEGDIISLIQALKSNEKLQVFSNAMSTQLTGEWEDVMEALKSELFNVYKNIPTCSTIIKIINRNLPIEAGHLNF